jgi:hypothetical protein
MQGSRSTRKRAGRGGERGYDQTPKRRTQPPARILRARVHFCAETGQIWLHEHRMLLVHAEAQATLRKELIDTLGMERARGLLTRMGYAAGVRDAELARTRAEDSTDLEAFMTGPQLHTLEGIVRATPIKVELEPPRRNLLCRNTLGKFLGRPVASPPLRHPQRAGVLDPDRLRLRLHLRLHGAYHPLQGSRVHRDGAQQLPHHWQAGRGMG